MNVAHRAVRRAVTWMSVLLLVGTMLSSMSPPTTRAAQESSGDAALDLPAMALAPADLADAGQASGAYDSATTVDRAGNGSLASLIGAWTDQVTDDDIQAALESAGLGSGYHVEFRLRADPEDPRSDVVRDIDSSMFAFAAEDGASEALSQIDDLTADSTVVERIDPDQPVGDESVLLRMAAAQSDQAPVLNLAFRTGRLVAVIAIHDYVGTEPDAGELEALGAKLVDRIGTVLGGDAPGLGSRVLRLTSDEFHSLYEVRRDQYLRLSGDDVPLDLDDADTLAARAELAGEATDVYALSQFMQRVETEPPVPDQFAWVVQLYRFADDQAASDWLAVHSDPATEAAFADLEVREVEPLADFPTFGDESTSITYLRDHPEGYTDRIFRVVSRTAAVVADAEIVAFEDDSPLEAFQALVTDQIGCLTGSGCPEPVTISDAVAGRVSGGEPGGQPTETNGPFDLSRLTLAPADLEKQGMTGFGLGLGQTAFLNDVAATTAAAHGADEGEVAQTLGDAGFVRRYDSYLYHLEDASDPNSVADRMIVSYVLEFADPDGAAAAFPFLEDESGSETAEDVPDAPSFGDQSEVTHDIGTDQASGDTSAQLDLTFQLGNLHAGVAIVDWTGEEPAMADVEALGNLLLDRIERAQTDGASGLGAQALRLAEVGIAPTSDYYVIADGTAIPLSGESAKDVRDRERAATAAGRTDVYRIWQPLFTGTEDTADDAWYLLELSRFTDDAGAGAWVAGVENNLRTNDAYADVEVRADAASVGDEAVAYRYTSGDAHFRGFVLRIGALTAVLDVYGPETPPEDALGPLLDAQAACMQDGGCVEPLAMPSALAAYVSALSESGGGASNLPPAHGNEVPGAKGNDDGAGTEGETYVSPTFGYSIAWDPGAWVPVGGTPDDGIQLHVMGNVLAIIVIQGVEDRAGDPDECLTAMGEDAGGDTPLVPADDLPAPQTAEGAAGGVYTLGNYAIFYLECRTLVPGQSVLQIRFGAPTGDYAAALPAVEALLAGITIPSSDARSNGSALVRDAWAAGGGPLADLPYWPQAIRVAARWP